MSVCAYIVNRVRAYVVISVCASIVMNVRASVVKSTGSFPRLTDLHVCNGAQVALYNYKVKITVRLRKDTSGPIQV